MKKSTTNTTTTKTLRTTTRSTTVDGNAGETTTTTTTTRKTSSSSKSSKSSSSSSTALMMDAFLSRIDDEETPGSSSLVALASRIEKECFPRLEDKDIPTNDDLGDGVVRSKQQTPPSWNRRRFRRIRFVFSPFFFNWSTHALSLSLFLSSITTTDEELVALHHRVRVSRVARAFKQLLCEEKFRGRFNPFQSERGGFLHRV